MSIIKQISWQYRQRLLMINWYTAHFVFEQGAAKQNKHVVHSSSLDLVCKKCCLFMTAQQYTQTQQTDRMNLLISSFCASFLARRHESVCRLNGQCNGLGKDHWWDLAGKQRHQMRLCVVLKRRLNRTVHKRFGWNLPPWDTHAEKGLK